MRTHTGVARRMFGALAQRGINISMINTSEVRISVVVDRPRGPEALERLGGVSSDVRMIGIGVGNAWRAGSVRRVHLANDALLTLYANGKKERSNEEPAVPRTIMDASACRVI